MPSKVRVLLNYLVELLFISSFMGFLKTSPKEMLFVMLLDNGNNTFPTTNTCPATMQVLQTKEFIPNCTLQGLVWIWSDSVRHRVDSSSSPTATTTTTESTLSHDHLLAALTNLESRGENRLDSLKKIVRFAQDSKKKKPRFPCEKRRPRSRARWFPRQCRCQSGT